MLTSNNQVDSKYRIERNDKDYGRFRKQIDILNDTSLNLENVVPMLNNTTFNDDNQERLKHDGDEDSVIVINGKIVNEPKRRHLSDDDD